jgi:hypothetical protein
MPGAGLYPLLKPGTLHDNTDDIARLWAYRMRAEAAGEVAWAAHVLGSEEHDAVLRATMARALRMAAVELEKASDAQMA